MWYNIITKDEGITQQKGNKMSRKEALEILNIYSYHLEKQAEAIKENDQEAIDIHTRVIELMQRDYAKASAIVEKLLK